MYSIHFVHHPTISCVEHSYFLATNNNRPASSMPVALAATMVLPELKGKKMKAINVCQFFLP